jgi:hypothetical protein
MSPAGHELDQGFQIGGPGVVGARARLFRLIGMSADLVSDHLPGQLVSAAGTQAELAVPAARPARRSMVARSSMPSALTELASSEETRVGRTSDDRAGLPHGPAGRGASATDSPSRAGHNSQVTSAEHDRH